MIAAATRDEPEGDWQLGDITTWTADEPYDLVFSNATLQWLPDHATLYPRLFAQVAPGGAFAVQIPVFHTTALQRVLLALAAEPAWRERLRPPRAPSSPSRLVSTTMLLSVRRDISTSGRPSTSTSSPTPTRP